MVRQILVTGGAGNLGGSLSRRLASEDDTFVTIVDNLSTGAVWKLPAENRRNWRFVKADVNDWTEIAPIFAAEKFDYVFHYAAVVGVSRTLDNPIDVLRDIKGLENFLKLSKSVGVKRVFFSSSSEVYGEPVEIPQREDTTPLNSRLPYAIVKNVGEAFLKSYQQEYGLNYTVLRFFNTYGPLQSEDFVISKFIRLAQSGKDLPIYGDGQQTRTFCHVDDNVAFALKLLRGDLGVNETFNVGSDQEITILHLAEEIIRLTGSKSKIEHRPALVEGDMTRRKPDTSRMNAILGSDLVALEDGLRDCIRNAEEKLS